MTRRLLCAAALLGLAAGGARRGAAQADTTARTDTSARDTTARKDTTARDTTPAYLPVFAAATPDGPLPRGTRYSFTVDSFVLSNVQTLSDLLAHIPGVYVARGGIYGQAEIVLYGARGAAGLELYWDGVPYLPIGRDSVFLDPARISLAPLERVDVIVLPALLRVYLVTRRQRATETASEVGILTGEVRTANYRGAFLRRWRSGVGLSLVADYNHTDGIGGTSSTPFNSVDLWLKAEYLPSPHVGASYQVLSSSWNRSAGDVTPPLTEAFHYARRDGIFRLFAAARPDGLGPRAELTFATASATRDSAVHDRSLSQAVLAVRDLEPATQVAVALRTQDAARPWQLEGSAAWLPLPALTLAGDARHARYSLGRSGNRAHLAAGLALPHGFSVHGDAAWAHDLQAPLLATDGGQRTFDLSGAVRWERPRAMLEAGAASRDPFTPLGWAAGLRSLVGLSPSQHTRYVTIHGGAELAPGLHFSGWYFNPLVVTGQDFEPPQHARVSLTFDSKFWRVYRSGVFELRGEAAMDSWSRGTAGVDTSGLRVLPGASFAEVNIELRIAGVTIFWIQRNATLFRGSYVPGLDFPRRFQFYGVRWLFTN
ncbi:MAG TPA: TonB-dependent receptor [Gemmatimonadales bacterium]|nr:TonB-dependent receptor [Gemmatimonadales bacterium]